MIADIAPHMERLAEDAMQGVDDNTDATASSTAGVAPAASSETASVQTPSSMLPLASPVLVATDGRTAGAASAAGGLDELDLAPLSLPRAAGSAMSAAAATGDPEAPPSIPEAVAQASRDGFMSLIAAQPSTRGNGPSGNIDIQIHAFVTPVSAPARARVARC